VVDQPAGRPDDSPDPDPDPTPPPPPPPTAIDRAMLDQIFGDVLPDTTSDERDAVPGSGSYTEQWYRENTPPHHG
jgi:hypothetical protein